MNKWFSEEILKKEAVLSHNFTDLTRRLGLKNYCGNRNTVKKYVQLYDVDISHFDFKPDYSKRKPQEPKLLIDILTEKSYYCRGHLKKRLYADGLKHPVCEICGQSEWWNEKKMSMILDHINGINNDNRLENLRIICPNCNNTLDTNGGKNIKFKQIRNKYFCTCGAEIGYDAKVCVDCGHKNQRRVERLSVEILQQDISELGYRATGRKYGVSDSAIRKWLK